MADTFVFLVQAICLSEIKLTQFQSASEYILMLQNYYTVFVLFARQAGLSFSENADFLGFFHTAVFSVYRECERWFPVSK